MWTKTRWRTSAGTRVLTTPHSTTPRTSSSKRTIASLWRHGWRAAHGTIRIGKRSFSMRTDTTDKNMTGENRSDENRTNLENAAAVSDEIHGEERRSRKNIGILEGRI